MKEKSVRFFNSILVLFFFAQCFTGKIYDKAFPSIQTIVPSDIKSIELRDDVIVFEEKGKYFPKFNCISIEVDHFYRYISPDFYKPCPESKNLFFKEVKGIPINGLPIPDENNTILLLKDSDYFNHYANDASEHLKGIKTKEAYLDKKKNTVFLKSENGQCFTMARKEYSDKTVSYSPPFVRNATECNKSANSELADIEITSIEGAILVLEFQEINDKKFYQFPLSKIPNSLRKMIIRPMIGFEAEPNYAYLLLFPLTIPLDLITFPFQVIYIFIVGSVGSVR